jgi:hypothetical protein
MEILHRVGIKSSPDEVYKALTAREGLAAWWTNDTQGESKVGGALKFRFSANGTKIRFDIKQAGDHAIVLFRHQNWKEPVEFMHHCSTKWAVYLMSLKSLLETRKGSPNPNDTHISGDGPD